MNCFRLFCVFLLLVSGQFLPVGSAYAQRGLTELPDPDPQKELASFEVAEGFTVNLFASEPMVVNPTQMNWDSQGRLWVATSETYPHIKPRQVANDKIVVLEDTDHDGVADKQTVFADGLLMPTAILPGDGGVYVGSSTELLHLKDTDGDGKADQKTIILSGFGTEDTHHVIHTLRRGPDGRIYINQSIYTHSHLETPRGVRRLLAGGTWRFDARTLDLEVFTRGLVNPWGHVFNQWGQSFETDGAGGDGINYVFPDIVMLTAHNAARIVRGLNPGQPKHCGLDILSGDQLPKGWSGRLVTNDFRGNRINSFELAESGSGYVSVQKDHLLSSNYVSFRPIDTLMGPDGSIYVADWYNPIIQHGEVDFRDKRRDHEHGRIWRIAPKNLKPVSRKPLPQCSIQELLGYLGHEGTNEKWWRDMARAELTSRDRKQVVSAVVEWYNDREKNKLNASHDRLEALWVLQRWKQTDDAILEVALNDKDHRCRAAAVRILKDFLALQPALKYLGRAIRDQHPQVRLEALHALRKLGGPDAIRLAALAVSSENDRFLDFSLWQTFREMESIWLPEVQKNPEWLSSRPEVLLYAAQAAQSNAAVSAVLQLWQAGKFSAQQTPAVLAFVAQRGEPKHLDLLWKRASSDGNGKISVSDKEALLNSLAGTALKRRVTPSASLDAVIDLLGSNQMGIRLVAAKLAGLWKVQSASTILKRMIEDNKQPMSLRGEASRSLALLGGKENQQYLLSIANGKRLPELRTTAINALININLPLAARMAVSLLQDPPDNINVNEVLAPFLARRQGPRFLAKALQKATLSPEIATIGVQRAMSLSQKNPGLIAAFQKAGKLDPVGKQMSPPELQKLVADVIKLGNIQRGEAIYRRDKLLCMKCHAIGGAGGKVGPDLSSIGASAPVDYLIKSLILPSDKIKEGYHSVQVVTVDGLVKSGVPLIRNEQEIQIRDAEGKVETISMDDVEFIKNTTVSLMPADLTSKLRRDEMIDLVRFLSALGKTGELVVSKQRYVRTWKVIIPGDNIRAVNDAIRHHGMKYATGDDPLFSWATVYSLVDGSFPIADLAPTRGVSNISEKLMRFEIDVVNAGKIGLKIENPQALRIWIGNKELKMNNQIQMELPKGRHRVMIAAKNTERSNAPIRIELIDLPGSSGQASLVN